MRLNSKVTWGLAWAGLALVVAVPSMDFLTGKGGTEKAATMTSDMDAVKTASVETTKTATTKVTSKGVTIIPAGTPVGEDPVDKLLAKGKKLPSYISGGDETASAEPVKAAPRVVVPATTSNTQVGPQDEPTEVASIDPNPEPVAPQPYPLSMRPHWTASSTSTATVTPKPATINKTPAAPAATGEQPLILDETAVADREAIDPTPTGDIGATDSAAPARWDSESLAHYLARKGLLDSGSQSQASVSYSDTPSGTYDPDGFFLSEGPNGQKIRPPAPIGDDEPPKSFSLF